MSLQIVWNVGANISSNQNGIGMEKKKKHASGEHPQPTKINPLQARYLIVEIVKQDMVYENAREYGKSCHYCKKRHRFKNMCRSLK